MEVTCFNMYVLPVNLSLDFSSQIFNKLLLIKVFSQSSPGIGIKLFVKTVLYSVILKGQGGWPRPPPARSAVNHTTPAAWIIALSSSLVLYLDFALDFGSEEGRMLLNS